MNTAGPLIYVIEDESEVSRLVCRTLTDYGFRAEGCSTAGEALRRMAQQAPALAVVDLQLPDMDGTELVRLIRDRHDAAILILTGRGSVSDRVLGLEFGADDYMVKPFDPRELVARVRSILRRHGSGEKSSYKQYARFAGWTFDRARNSLVSADGREEALSAAEARMLAAFLEKPNRILPRETLLPERELGVYDRVVDVRISRLRKKLGDDPQSPAFIKTVYGAGYLFCASVVWE